MSGNNEQSRDSARAHGAFHNGLVEYLAKEQDMTPEEIVSDLNTKNRSLLSVRGDIGHLTREQVLALMDAAAIQGFRLGSDVALSIVKGALQVQLSRHASAQ